MDLEKEYKSLVQDVSELDDKLDNAKGALQKFIRDRLEKIWPYLHKYDPEKYGEKFDHQWSSHISLKPAGPNNEYLLVTVYEDFRGEVDETSYTIPYRLFFDISDYQQVFLEEATKEANRRALEKKQELEKQDKWERETYERLKKKFEG